MDVDSTTPGWGGSPGGDRSNDQVDATLQYDVSFFLKMQIPGTKPEIERSICPARISRGRPSSAPTAIHIGTRFPAFLSVHRLAE